ncbi:hypothetical protein [Streptomyces sp. NPDC048603]|uniref:hypothetical protein n=1 Tax=Streptomyces sp. NPDC048603 TaxID=3365577 RepID=UPI0037160312
MTDNEKAAVIMGALEDYFNEVEVYDLDSDDGMGDCPRVESCGQFKPVVNLPDIGIQ